MGRFYSPITKPNYKPLPVLKGKGDIYDSPRKDPPKTTRTNKYPLVKIFFMVAMMVAVFWFLYLVSEGNFKSTQSVNQTVDQPIDVDVYNNVTTDNSYEVNLNATVPIVIEKIVVNCYDGGCEQQNNTI